MKKIVLLIAIIVTIASCSKVKKGEYLISGIAKGIADGKMVILTGQTDTGIQIAVDTVKVKAGKFEIKGKVNEPKIYTVTIEGLQQAIPIVLETGEIDITVDKDSIWKSKIGGTFNNEQFNTFNTKTNAIVKKKMAFQNANMQKAMQAQQTNDSVTMNKLNKEFGVIQEEENKFIENYPKENPKSFLSVLILGNMFKSPKFNLEDVKKTFNNFDESVKNTKPGKEMAEKLKSIEKLNAEKKK